MGAIGRYWFNFMTDSIQSMEDWLFQPKTRERFVQVLKSQDGKFAKPEDITAMYDIVIIILVDNLARLSIDSGLLAIREDEHGMATLIAHGPGHVCNDHKAEIYNKVVASIAAFVLSVPKAVATKRPSLPTASYIEIEADTNDFRLLIGASMRRWAKYLEWLSQATDAKRQRERKSPAASHERVGGIYERLNGSRRYGRMLSSILTDSRVEKSGMPTNGFDQSPRIKSHTFGGAGSFSDVWIILAS
ncbi:hypothetical protein BJ875DRAFT_438631 [Amylocarpus encephaloides]|uniref:Uncharacterized protein n=1 Tax=Amylocarpus encephaloides TaxID=45428 RepID=A0A9P7YPD3_9HELO|nr:hypothetical protein BJ875DRAFT_438631 [Amylocarpus encephaloides]